VCQAAAHHLARIGAHARQVGVGQLAVVGDGGEQHPQVGVEHARGIQARDQAVVVRRVGVGGGNRHQRDLRRDQRAAAFRAVAAAGADQHVVVAGAAVAIELARQALAETHAAQAQHVRQRTQMGGGACPCPGAASLLGRGVDQQYAAAGAAAGHGKVLGQQAVERAAGFAGDDGDHDRLRTGTVGKRVVDIACSWLLR
jgi:hypothetical protein